ncbi:helix-turn-helix domain-containing protein [Streptomyces canus]|uniref:helix-turn-helix domain-containing protein n=1 Tax=Streptomyces canus TaxID=58343 RepID=UPI00324B286E
MMEQPFFGRRLKELRTERGLSQAALGGGEISTGYLSRLESGARQPTERVITYLTTQLGVDRSAFESPPVGSSLAQALSIAASTDSDEAMENLAAVLGSAQKESLLQRWQALWLISRYRRRRGESAKEQACLEELARLSEELALPELRCRAWTQLAQCLRSSGDITRAIGIAEKAYRLAKDTELTVHDVAPALLTLVALEVEAGRLPDARAHADELVPLVEGRTDALRAEALWAAATVRLRHGDYVAARQFLEQAMTELDSRIDLILWVRLRLAAASLYLQLTPPRTELTAECLSQVEAPLSLVGTPPLRQELLLIEALLAFQEKKFDEARALHDELSGEDLRLTYRDRIRLDILDSLLLILEGHREDGITALKELGEKAQQMSHIDLSAEIWRVLAETLVTLTGPAATASHGGGRPS